MLTWGFSQPSIGDVLKKYNTQKIPYISVDSLLLHPNYLVLDARENNEFNVSHLKNAIYVGYDHFSLPTVTEKVKDKNKPIVVYCSIGVRSEDIAEKLKRAGYTNVFNLYGGIFEWKNKGGSVYDNSGNETQKVHAYSKEWSSYLKTGIKIYE